MKRTYQRSAIFEFYELTIEQQIITLDEFLIEVAQQTKYVLWNDEPLPLCNFMRMDKGLFHGAYSMSAFSAYLVRINRTNEEATVAYAHW